MTAVQSTYPPADHIDGVLPAVCWCVASPVLLSCLWYSRSGCMPVLKLISSLLLLALIYVYGTCRFLHVATPSPTYGFNFRCMQFSHTQTYVAVSSPSPLSFLLSSPLSSFPFLPHLSLLSAPLSALLHSLCLLYFPLHLPPSPPSRWRMSR